MVTERTSRIILRFAAVVTRPGFSQGAVHGEMLVGQQGPDILMENLLNHKAVETIAGLQSLAILGNRRRVPHRVVRRKPDEPAGQKIVVQLLHQLPVTPHAVTHVPPQRAQHLFGRDRRAPVVEYRVRNSRSRSLNTSRTRSRMLRRGCLADTRCSGELYENNRRNI